MSDHPREAEDYLRRINVCDDVWYNVYAWFGRAELGLKIATICARFDALVDSHLRGIRQWTLGNIGFRCSKNGIRAVLWKDDHHSSGVLLEKTALLDVPPPSNLVGFNQIRINYLDQNVIAFLHRIGHLFDADTTLIMPIYPLINQWRVILERIWPLMAPRLYQLDLPFGLNSLALRTLISPSVLRDCANLRMVDPGNDFPEMPADDRADASDGQALAMWLHTPRTDGRPKVLFSYYSDETTAKLEGLKMAFICADLPVSYIISMHVNYACPFYVEPFEVDNERTRERMTFHRTSRGQYSDEYNFLLKRGPIWWDESDWADIQFKAIYWDFGDKVNVVSFEDFVFDADDFE